MTFLGGMVIGFVLGAIVATWVGAESHDWDDTEEWINEEEV